MAKKIKNNSARKNLRCLPSQNIAASRVSAKAARVSHRTAKYAVNETREAKSAPKFNTYRFSIYVYWLIILFFIGATFYILGRSQEILKNNDAPEITETVPALSESLPNAQLADVASEYVSMGKQKLLSGDTSGALHDLSLAIEAVETFSDAYVYRGEAYMQLSDYPNALADLSRAIELSKSAIAFYDRGILNMRLENYDAALSDFNSALAEYQASPNDVLSAHDIYSRRATLHLWAKNWNESVVDFNKAIGLDPNDYEDYAGRAEAFTAIGEFQAALADYLSAVKVIADTIQAEPSESGREVMSRAALSYFEKSAAIRLSLDDTVGAKSDLESAKTIAMALSDSDQVGRLDALLDGIM